MSELEPPPADESEGSPASPPEGAETAASTPPRKRTRRSSPRKAAAESGVESDGTGALEVSEAAPPDIEVAEAPPAPARRSRRRKAAEPAPQESAPADAPPAEGTAPSAPDDAPPAATDISTPAPDEPTAATTPATEESPATPPEDTGATTEEKPSRRRKAAGTGTRRRSRQPLAAAVEAEAVADALETGEEAPGTSPASDAEGSVSDETPTAAALTETAEPELTDVEEFPAAEVGTEDLLDTVAEMEGAEAAPEAGAPPRKRRRERRRTRPKKEAAPEAEAGEGTLEEGAGTLAPASEEGEETPPELVAEESELLGTLDVPADATDESAGEEADEEEAEDGTESVEGESAASRNRKRRRRRRRRSGLALREEAPQGEASESAPEVSDLPDIADTEAELLSAETGADLDTEEDVEAGIEDLEDVDDGEPDEEDDGPAAVTPSEDGGAAERRARRSRLPNRRDGRRRPSMEQAVIENPSDPAGSPLRVDIQPGVGSRLIGRSIIGFREAYDIGGGDRAAVSFHVMVLDDGSQWRVKGSEEFDPWVERILPGEED